MRRARQGSAPRASRERIPGPLRPGLALVLLGWLTTACTPTAEEQWLESTIQLCLDNRLWTYVYSGIVISPADYCRGLAQQLAERNQLEQRGWTPYDAVGWELRRHTVCSREPDRSRAHPSCD